jgi:hypothetical protein
MNQHNNNMVIDHCGVTRISQDAYDELIDGVRLKLLNININHAFTHSYRVSQADASLLQSMFPDRFIHQNPNSSWLKESAHPVLAILNEYCNHHASNLARSRVEDGYVVITVGDAASPKIKSAAHNCLLVNTKREAVRIVTNTIKMNVSNNTLRAKALCGARTTQCTDGCHNCNYKAQCAFFIHSAYDITPEQLYETFDRHDIEEAFVYMYIPYAFYNSLLKNVDEKFFNTSHQGSNTIFMMRDHSIPYVHSTKNWDTWSKFTVIEGATFSIVRENYQNHGPLMIIRLTRVAATYPGKIYMTLPLAEIAREYVYVPSIREALKTNFTANQGDIKHHMIPKHVVSTLMSYSSRTADEAYKYTELATVAGGLLRTLKIGSVIYADKWIVDPMDFNDAVISIFIFGAMNRATRTQTISKTFAYLKDMHGKCAVSVKLSHYIDELKYKFKSNKFFKILEDPTDDSYLWNYRIVELTDVAHQQTIDVRPTPPLFNLKPAVPSVKTVLPDYIQYIEPQTKQQPVIEGVHYITRIPVAEVPSGVYYFHDHPHSVTIINNHGLKIEDYIDLIPHHDTVHMSDANGALPLKCKVVLHPALEFRNRVSSCRFDREWTSFHCNEFSVFGHTLKHRIVAHERHLTSIVCEMRANACANLCSIARETGMRAQGFGDTVKDLRKRGAYSGLALIVNEAFANADYWNSVSKNKPTETPSEAPIDVPASPPAAAAPIATATATSKPVLPKKVHFIDSTTDTDGDEEVKTSKTQYFFRTTPTEEDKPYFFLSQIACEAGLGGEYEPSPENAPTETKPTPSNAGVPPGPASSAPKPKPNAPQITADDYDDDSINSDEEGTSLMPGSCNYRGDVALMNNILQSIAPAKNLPTKYEAGHCFFDAVFRTYYHDSTTYEEFLKAMYRNTVDHIRHCAALGNYKCSRETVDRYFVKRDIQTPAFHHICELASIALGCTINVIYNNQLITTYGLGDRLIAIGFQGAAGNGHFFPIRGGTPAQIKFEKLVDTLRDQIVFGKTIELSAAPGYLTTALARYGVDMTAAIFKPGLQLDKDLMKDFELWDIRTHEYDNLNGLKTIVNAGKYRTYICDAANPICSEHIIRDIVRLVYDVLKPHDNFVVKTFMNMQVVADVASHFTNVNTWVNPEATGNERYFILADYHEEPIHNAVHMFERYLTPITAHIVAYDPHKTANYAKAFVSKYAISKVKYEELKMAPFGDKHKFTINAITGYASASKTTLAVANNPNGMFISPTKQLSIQHNKRGVVSYTQHAALLHAHKYDTIVIDEITQFPLEYVMLIHALAPNAKITILGDVYQTPFVNLTTYNKLTDIMTLGLENNINRVYCIPQDVTELLNHKYNLRIISESKVQKSLCISKTIDKLKKLKFMAFNDDTVKELRNDGYAADTITTTQGSREDTFCFYIDGKSITSQLINRQEWVYTAMTRHKNQLVLCGATDTITKHFAIWGTNIPSYEEFSNITLPADTVAAKTTEYNAETDYASLIKINAENMRNDKPTIDTAITIIENMFVKANEASRVAAYTQPDLPPIGEGNFKCDVIDILQPTTVTNFNMLCPDTPLIKNQVSNNKHTTAYTMIKRYSKRTVKRDPRAVAMDADRIVQGIAHALYGNRHSVDKLKKDLYMEPETLSHHYREYLISLQSKMDSTNNSGIADIEQEMIWYNECLTFINKKQGKFSPADDFDTQDKCGQGISAMSKRVNLILCAYARALNVRLNDIIRRNNRPIILATLGSDEEIAAQIQALLDATPIVYDQDDRDMREWDSVFDKTFAETTHRLLGYAGVPNFINDWFFEFRMHWKLVYLTAKTANMTLEGESKQHSGSPLTLVENTYCNLGMTHAIFKFIKLVLELIKGDDNSTRALHTELTAFGKQYLLATNKELKYSGGVVGEFAAFIITPTCVGPDLIRRAHKFLGANYMDQKHFNESCLSTVGWAKIIKSEKHLNEIALATANLYGRDRVTPEHVKVLYSFLLNTVPTLKDTDLKTQPKVIVTSREQ